MLAFIDESGDPGRRIEKGSSPYFTVAVVTFDENEAAEACDARIDLLRSELRLPSSFEFHFTHNSKRVREAFLQAVAPYEFFYHTFALNKDPNRLYGPGFDRKDSLYKFTARLVLENAAPYLRQATVVIDRSGERRFRDELATYLRQRIRGSDGARIIRKVKIQNSHGNNLLQLADYVAGVLNRVVTEKKDAEALHKFIALHEVTRRVWPQN